MASEVRVVKYFMRRFWPDLLTGVVALILAYAAFRWVATPRLQLLGSVVVTLVATSVIIFLRTKDTDFYFEPLGRPAEKNNWVGYGVFQFSRLDGCFKITASDSGFILTRALNWSDYALRFRFKILTKCLGVIVRAVNLSNLAMLQIVESGIRPHIRVNGAWHAWEIEEANLGFEGKLDLNQWYDCAIKCDKDDVRIRIGRPGQMLCDRAWRIPRGSVNFKLQESKFYSGEGGMVPKTIPFMINLEYGTVGFRNDADEDALVREVLIEKLSAQSDRAVWFAP